MAEEEIEQPDDSATDAEAVGEEELDSQAMVQEALAEAQAAVEQMKSETDAASGPEDTGAVAPGAMDLPDLGEAESPSAAGGPGLDMLGDVELDVTVELGRTEMLVEDVLRLAEGSVVELDKLAGDPVDVYVNGRLVARGEVLVLNENFCIRISEIVDDLQEQAAAAAELQHEQAEA